MNYELIQFPFSALLAVTFLIAVIAVFYFLGNNRVVKALCCLRCAQVLLAVGALLLALEGTFSWPIHSSFIFVIYALVLLTSLSFTILNGFKRKAKLGFMLNHLGLFLIVWAALFGAPDVKKVKMMVGVDGPTNVAYAADGKVTMLPFEMQLEEFHIDYYEDEKSPKQFTSHLLVAGKKMDTSVNHPCSYEGYTIYQDSYDREQCLYTVLQLVKDPWLPFVYIGMILLAAGSMMLLLQKSRAKYLLPILLVVTILFTGLTVAKINFGTMMPALRSWWFVPHLFIYMVAYSLMAMAVIGALIRMFRKGGEESHCNASKSRLVRDTDVVELLFRSSSALLIIGMLTGSVWAREAWGDYWAWDAKENWAAVTWLVSLIYLHLNKKKGGKAFIVVLLAFLALQITWYGVNYLPSAGNSLHTYN